MALIRQVSVFIENKEGRLSKVLRILGDKGINIRALSLADTNNFGVLRLIVNESSQAVKALQEAGFRVSETEVLAVEVPDEPGGLAQVLEKVALAKINIEYMYAFLARKTDNAIVIFRISEPQKAIDKLKECGVQIIDNEILTYL